MKTEATINLYYPLRGQERAVKVTVDLERQVIEFRQKGKRIKRVALWVIEEQTEEQRSEAADESVDDVSVKEISRQIFDGK